MMNELIFDHNRPFGPLQDGDSCDVFAISKRLQFHSSKSTGYDYGMQLSGFLDDCSMKHVFSIEMYHMVQKHGYNAIAVVFDKNGGDMFSEEDDDKNYDVWLKSQFICHWAATRVTIMLDPEGSKIWVYVEPIESDLPKGMNARVYQSIKDDEWTHVGEEGDVRMNRYDVEWMTSTSSMPSVGVVMSGGLGNQAKIVPVSPLVQDALLPVAGTVFYK